MIFADSPQDAYEKALTMITEHEIGYLNEHHKAIRTRFWGLRELNLSNEDMDRAGNAAGKPHWICPPPEFNRAHAGTAVRVAALAQAWGAS